MRDAGSTIPLQNGVGEDGRSIVPAGCGADTVYAPAGGGVTQCEMLTLGELLDGRFKFRLTCFQRAYAWRPNQVARLLSDLRRAQALNRRYCLGRLMLARSGAERDVELVDGHQRLLTLTMLFAALRDVEPDEVRKGEIHSLISESVIAPSGVRLSSWRLTIQAIPAPLFEQLVQEPGGTLSDTELTPAELSETERNILDCRDYLRAELCSPEETQEQRRSLLKFLVQNCYLIALVAEDAEEAWELVGTEQDTRLAFTPADQAKSILLAATKGEERTRCSHLWEECESLLCSNDMQQLLGHIRAASWRGRSKSSTRPEMQIVDRFGSGAGLVDFMEAQLLPHARRLHELRAGRVGESVATREALFAHTERMSWLELHAWVPAALLWLERRGPEFPETAQFFARLERLVWVFRINGTDPEKRETRILDLLTEIEAGVPVAAMERLKIDSAMRSDLIQNLKGQNFAAKHYAVHVLRRLSILLGADTGPIERDEVTLEHILPRNPPRSSEWRRSFRSNEDVKAWAQRLGNVTLLSGQENQQAGTREWRYKREIFARSGFALARHAAEHGEWTSRTIQRRTDALTNILLASWELIGQKA